MAKWCSTTVIDGALDKIALATGEVICSAQPTNRTEAVTTYGLSAVATLTSGDFTKAAGDTSGRKVTIAQKTGVSVTANGTATHVALVDATNLLYVTTCTSQAVTSGNTATFNSWKVEINAPT